MPRLDIDALNLILYADHGISLHGVETVDLDEQIERAIPPADIVLYAYPNLYIANPSAARKDAFARKIARETAVDFAFYRAGTRFVVGGFSSVVPTPSPTAYSTRTLRLLVKRDEYG